MSACRNAGVFLYMSRLSAILYVVDWRKSAYYIVCKKEVFAAESGERVQKRTNFPKICSFYIDSYC